MANEEQLQRLRRGVQEWNAWRIEHREEEIDLRQADLSRANLRQADLSWANLSWANLGYALLDDANLSRANLSAALLNGANLRQADLSRVYFREEDLIIVGPDGSIRFGRVSPTVNLNDADLSRARLDDANLSRADLSGANLSRANLSGANLSRANLSRADFIRVYFSHADLSYTDLSQADLSHANLDGAEMSLAVFSGTVFANNDFRLVKGLVTAEHRKPSHIDLYSVQLPQDGSALHFLRGVGVPDDWIDFYRAHMMHPIQYYSVFISYSSKDEQLARRLHADLQDYGVRCWFAPHDLRPGQLIRKGIDEAIHLQDKLLLILSEHSVESGWVAYEVETALSREIRQKREILFPIRIDDAIFHSATDWSRELREKRHIGDFTEWSDPQHYQTVFERLLRDFKTQA